MKKALVGVTAVGAVVGLRRIAKRIGPKMREHCEQMMGAPLAGRAEATDRDAAAQRMHERCEQRAARVSERRQPIATA